MEIQDKNGKKKLVPDWKKFLGNEDLGDILGTINQKLYGLSAAGAHAGKAINKEDADLAVMSTHGLVQFVISKLMSEAKRAGHRIIQDIRVWKEYIYLISTPSIIWNATIVEYTNPL